MDAASLSGGDPEEAEGGCTSASEGIDSLHLLSHVHSCAKLLLAVVECSNDVLLPFGASE